MKRLRVAVGIVQCKGEVLIAERRQGQHLAGLWEFPGGKIEAGETLGEALMRELAEELGLSLDIPPAVAPWKVIDFDYPEKPVRLEFVRLDLEQRAGRGMEGQSIRWVPVNALAQVHFPPANQAVVSALQASADAESAQEV